jgi:hypothetical protein
MMSDSRLLIYALYEGLCDMLSAGTSKGTLFECVIVFNYVFDIFFALKKKLATVCVVY